MSTYAQFVAAAERGDIRRVHWLCGEQRVLVEEIVDTVRAFVDPAPMNILSVQSSKDPWAALHQYPLDPVAPRLVIIRDADSVSNWKPLDRWLDHLKAQPGLYVLFVSDAHDLPDVGPHEQIQARRRHGRVVRCSTPNDNDTVAWIRRHCPAMGEDVAQHLLSRTANDMRAALSVADKLALFDVKPGTGVVDLLCDAVPGDSFVDLLIHHRKEQALLAAERLDEAEYPRVLGLLDLRLDTMAALWRAAREGLQARDMRAVPTFVAMRYMTAARHYDPRRCLFDRQVLAVVDDAVRRGARLGVLQALVVLW